MFIMIFCMTIIGLYCFFTKLAACLETVELFSERAYTCPDEFLKDQRKSDALHAANCFFLSLNGITLMLFGLSIFVMGGVVIPTSVLLIMAMVNVVQIYANRIILDRTGLNRRMNGIMTQWKTQKKITNTNDDEVRLYRMIRESVKNESYNIFYIILLLTLFCILP